MPGKAWRIKILNEISDRVDPSANDVSSNPLGTTISTSSMARIMIGTISNVMVIIPASNEARMPR